MRKRPVVERCRRCGEPIEADSEEEGPSEYTKHLRDEHDVPAISPRALRKRLRGER